MKKAALFILILALGTCASGFYFDHMFKAKGSLGHLSAAIEAFRFRSEKPAIQSELISREVEKANHGAIGLAKTLSNVAVNSLGSSTPATEASGEIFINATENHDALLNAQGGSSPGGTEIKGALSSVHGTVIPVQSTTDGREVIAVVQDGSIEDLSAVDRINAMNIPEVMREKILANYYQTGALPQIFVKEVRKSAREPARNPVHDADDAYNPKNF